MIDEKVLIERLEEEYNVWCDIYNTKSIKGVYDEFADGMGEGLGKSIEIINQLAEEHNNTSTEYINSSENLTSWIPCSEQEEPKENGKYLVYVQHYSNEDLYDICVVDWLGEWKVSYNWNILAWQPLPAPYQPKGNENEGSK